MIINENNLNALSENGSTFNNLQSFNNEDEDKENNDETETENDVLETRLEQGNDTGPENDDDDCNVTKAHVTLNPCYQNETIAKKNYSHVTK